MTNTKKPERILFQQPINIIQDVPTKYDPHWHHFTEMVFYPIEHASSVRPKFTIDQTTYELMPGDTLIIWASEMHSVEFNEPGTLVGLQFTSSLLTELPEFASFAHLFRNYHLFRSDDPNMESLAKYMHEKLRQIMAARNTSTPFHGVRELIHVYELFMQFGIHLQSVLLPAEEIARQRSGRTIDKINAACRYIAENCDKDLTLDDIANQIGFSSCYFSRVFKQTIQCNFVEYLTLQRLKRAQTLLADSDDAITTIAMESGFKSISTFNRVFQKYKGCSPSEFKRHYLQG